MFGLITLIAIPSLFLVSMIIYIVIGLIKMDKGSNDTFIWNDSKHNWSGK